jgi:hypothetical protein
MGEHVRWRSDWMGQSDSRGIDIWGGLGVSVYSCSWIWMLPNLHLGITPNAIVPRESQWPYPI